MRAPSSFHSASPFFQVAAVAEANSSTDWPLRAASPASTQGWKSSGRSSGNVSIRLAMSPLGSIAIAGTPSSAASSSSDRQRPVLPLPVMPMQTAWVVRSRES